MLNNNFIILNFPKFAGGKFISNCLSLSRYCCPQDPTTAEYLLENPLDYEYRFRAIMSTLPPTREKMINWISQYEFGDHRLYGSCVTQWQHGINQKPTELVKSLLTANFKLFLTAHGGDTLVRNLLKIWPQSTVIKLINHTKFSTISQKLKSNDSTSLDEYAGNYSKAKYALLSGPSWPTWEEFESVGYDIYQLPNYHNNADEISTFYNWKDINNRSILFDVDRSIFNRSCFLSAMKLLYEKLNLTDYNAELVDKFWQSYMALHVDNINVN